MRSRRFELEAALESALKASQLQTAERSAATRASPSCTCRWEKPERAEQAARAAVDGKSGGKPRLQHSRLRASRRISTRLRARTDFRTSIERDSFSALPRLGLGLAMIRDGELKAGREQIEIAVALDPTNSLLRSYAGKAYYEENSRERDRLAATQFELAQELDPLDPTSSFYDAILKQSQTRPVDALESLNSAIEKNDNRAVYRSKLLLDDDAAAQGATVAAIYGSLGFERLAVLESAKALPTMRGITPRIASSQRRTPIFRATTLRESARHCRRRYANRSPSRQSARCLAPRAC